MKPSTLLSQKQAMSIMRAALDHLAEWAMPSAEAFRNTVLGDGLLGINPMLGIESDDDVHHLHSCIQFPIAKGQMIDFGTIPNEIMKSESIRSRTMFESGDLIQPYEEWIAVAAWEGGCCGYYFGSNQEHPLRTFCIELYGIRIPPGTVRDENDRLNTGKLDVVIIYDIVTVEVERVGSTRVTPAKLIVELDEGDDKLQQELRGANCIDPMVTMLRLLADASIPVIHHPEPEKLNRQRLKQGRFPIPAHSVVLTKDYVSTLHGAGSVKAADRGGHHASPVAHSRRGHMRHLASGKIVPVRSSRVNWRDADELHRLFYRVPHAKP